MTPSLNTIKKKHGREENIYILKISLFFVRVVPKDNTRLKGNEKKIITSLKRALILSSSHSFRRSLNILFFLISFRRNAFVLFYACVYDFVRRIEYL